MISPRRRRICLIPRVAGIGGMVTFQAKLADGLARRGIDVSFDLRDEPYDAVLVTGGSRQLGQLWRARRRGARIVQRLDGMNWLHRRMRTGLRHFLRAEYGNWLLASIRAGLAQAIVYQSHFAQAWWERVHGPTRQDSSVVYNGVDLEVYSPQGPASRPDGCARLLLVEGSLAGGYELGLSHALDLASKLAVRLKSSPYRQVELMIVGRVAPEARRRAEQWLADRNQAGCLKVNWVGWVPSEQIPQIDRSAHVLYPADLNAACPNAVIESLACGTPVVAFDTGALRELVTDGAGRIVPYGGDPWRLDSPDLPALVEAAIQILKNPEPFRSGARARAEAALGLERMVDGYLEMLG